MKKALLSLCAASLVCASAFGAPSAKTYQVTGPIVEMTEKTIVVQKGDDRWEIARDEATKAKGNLKVGQKVTIHYRMTATTVELK
jgi:RNase P/RNase MRP subunit p29